MPPTAEGGDSERLYHISLMLNHSVDAYIFIELVCLLLSFINVIFLLLFLLLVMDSMNINIFKKC